MSAFKRCQEPDEGEDPKDLDDSVLLIAHFQEVDPLPLDVGQVGFAISDLVDLSLQLVQLILPLLHGLRSLVQREGLSPKQLQLPTDLHLVILVVINKLIGLLFEVVLGDEFPEVVELLNVLVFLPESDLLIVVREELVEHLLVNDVLPRLIRQLVVKGEILE